MCNCRPIPYVYRPMRRCFLPRVKQKTLPNVGRPAGEVSDACRLVACISVGYTIYVVDAVSIHNRQVVSQ